MHKNLTPKKTQVAFLGLQFKKSMYFQSHLILNLLVKLHDLQIHGSLNMKNILHLHHRQILHIDNGVSFPPFMRKTLICAKFDFIYAIKDNYPLQ